MASAKSSKNPNRTYTSGVCKACGGPTKRTTRKFCSRSCAKTGENNAAWKGGISKEPARYAKRYKLKYPERIRAARKLQEAIRWGKMQRQPCCACGRSDQIIEAHIPDYSKPLDVVWLCDHDHKFLHRLLVIERKLVPDNGHA